MKEKGNNDGKKQRKIGMEEEKRMEEKRER